MKYIKLERLQYLEIKDEFALQIHQPPVNEELRNCIGEAHIMTKVYLIATYRESVLLS